MDIYTAAKYLKIGYRIKRACWEPEECLTECGSMLEKKVWIKYGHFNPETRTFEDRRYLTDEHISAITLEDLLADDWEVVTAGLRKDFNKYGNPEYLDEPDWDNYVCKGWGDDEEDE